MSNYTDDKKQAAEVVERWLEADDSKRAEYFAKTFLRSMDAEVMLNTLAETCIALTRRVEALEQIVRGPKGTPPGTTQH